MNIEIDSVFCYFVLIYTLEMYINTSSEDRYIATFAGFSSPHWVTAQSPAIDRAPYCLPDQHPITDILRKSNNYY